MCPLLLHSWDLSFKVNKLTGNSYDVKTFTGLVSVAGDPFCLTATAPAIPSFMPPELGGRVVWPPEMLLENMAELPLIA